MATYTVQAPDGHMITLEGPDGASHEDVIAQAQRLYSAPQPPSVPNQNPSALQVAGAALSGMNPLPGMAQAVMHPVQTVLDQRRQMSDLRDQAAKDFKAGNYGDAALHGLGGVVPLLGPAVSGVIDTASDPKSDPLDVARQAGAVVGPMALGKVVPPVIRKAGGLLQSGAVPVAESALGVKAIQRGYGKTPGAAALKETSGIAPGAVADSARARLADLNSQLENAANASSTPGSLQGARDIIDQRASTAAGGNSTSTPAELAKMRAQLTEPQPGFAGVIDPATGKIAVDQSPANILRMKREFGKDFTRWNPLNPSGEMQTARKVYGALDSELDRTVPGAADLNQRISSLIPVAERGEQSDLNAGVTQRAMHRVAAHSGALLGAAGGYQIGGIPGGIAGLVVPEIMADPAVRMAAARGIYGAGGLLTTSGAQRLSQAGLLGSYVKSRKGLLEP